MAQACSSFLKSAIFAHSRNNQFQRKNLSSAYMASRVKNVKISRRSMTQTTKSTSVASLKNNVEGVTPANNENETITVLNQSDIQIQDLLLAASVFITPFLLDAEPASASGGAFGILEGRSFALLHPIVMAALFFYTLYAGYLGWQWRRVRILANDISELKKQIPQTVEGLPDSPLQAEVEKLTEERKELVKGGFRDKHFNAGSILLGGGVFIAVGGCLNTWMRTGKLFPGPHLFAGAGITVLWALAAALVPAMQKGDDNARSAHIALNTLNVLLFVWQIPTGIDIVYKVFQFTSWP